MAPVTNRAPATATSMIVLSSVHIDRLQNLVPSAAAQKQVLEEDPCMIPRGGRLLWSSGSNPTPLWGKQAMPLCARLRLHNRIAHEAAARHSP